MSARFEYPSATPRALEFLRESDAIEGIKGIPYERPEDRAPGRGHWGAYADMALRAEARAPISVATLALWQGLVCEEQTRFGHPLHEAWIGRIRSPLNSVDVTVGEYRPPSFAHVPALLEAWVVEVNHRASITDWDDASLIESIADSFQGFQAIHPFADGNGRVGRLAANWLALRLSQALIVFRAEERPAYYAAHRSRRAMRIFMAGKLREAILFGEEEAPATHIGYSHDRYRRPSDGRELVVERHDLLEALERWQGEERLRGR